MSVYLYIVKLIFSTIKMNVCKCWSVLMSGAYCEIWHKFTLLYHVQVMSFIRCSNVKINIIFLRMFQGQYWPACAICKFYMFSVIILHEHAQCVALKIFSIYIYDSRKRTLMLRLMMCSKRD